MLGKFLCSAFFAAFLISGSAQAQQNCVQGAFVGGIFTCLVGEPVVLPSEASREARQITRTEAQPVLPTATLPESVRERIENRNAANTADNIYLAGDRFKPNLGGTISIVPKRQSTATIGCRETLGGKLVCDIETID